MKKRIFQLFLILALLITAMAIPAQAAEVPENVQWIEIGSAEDFDYWFSGGGSCKLLTDGYIKGMTRYLKMTDNVTVTKPGTYYLNAGNYQVNVYWDLGGYTFTYKTPDTTGAARLFGTYNQTATVTIVNGTIDNQSAITGSHGGMFTVNKGQMVLEDVVIKDQGTHAFTAMGKVFSVNAGNTLTLNNVDFYLNNTNTAGTGKGGGIRCLGTLNMTDCNFISSATGKIEAGGILFLDGATVTMTGCSFSGGTAKNGGGIYASKATITATNCSISGGTATNGGGVYASESTLTATGCSFSNGIAATNGGCVYTTGGTLEATNCTFTDGKSANSGNNLYTISTTNELIGCTATITHTTANSFGGNLYVQGNTTLLKDCTITGGRSSGGGAMYSVNGALTCDNTHFSGGYATSEGGNLMHKNGSLTLQNGTTLTGGGCKASGGNLSLSNTAKFYMGDGITISGGSAKDGGNIYASLVEASSTAPVLNISGGLITGGTASNNGGNIDLAGLSGKLVTLNLTGGTVEKGTAEVGGGNILGAYATMNVSGTALVSGGASVKHGGGIYASTASTLNITGGTVSGGSTQKGGNIYMSSTNTVVKISGGVIENGLARECGGNIYHGNGKLTITGGIIRAGMSDTSGGNIHANMGYGNSAAASGKLTICDDGDASTPLPQILDGKSNCMGGGNIYVAAAGNVNETGANTLVLGNCIISGGKTEFAGKELYIAAIADLQILPEFDQTLMVYIEDAMLPATTVGGQLDPDRATCTGAFTGKLVLENYNNPYIYGNETGLFVTGAALIQDGGYTWFKSNAEAVNNYSEGMVLQAASGEMTLLGGSYLVDIAGQNVAITGSGSVTCFDSANDTFETFGTATIAGPALDNEKFLTQNGKNYYTLVQDGVYSFHRIAMELVSAAFRPSQAGIYYIGRWSCDDTLKSHIEGFGVAVSLKDFPSADFAQREDVLYTAFGADAFESGVQKTGVMISNILKDSTQERSAMNNAYAQMAIFSNAYITIDGATYAGFGVSMSMYDILKNVSDNLNQYYTKSEVLVSFMEQWGAKGLTGEPWNSLNFQVSEDVLKLNDLYAGLQPYYGELHDHADTGGTSDGKYTLDVWKTELNRLNMDFATIVDHRQSLHMYLEDWDNAIFIGGSEAATRIKDRTGVFLHYNMIFSDPKGLEAVVSAFPEFNYRVWTEEDRVGTGGQWHFDYPAFTAERFSEVCAAVYDNGGFVSLVHPKADGYIESENPADAYFHEGTAIEVFYTYHRSLSSWIIQKNYDLWTGMLKAGYKVYASAGNDEHAMPSDKAVSVIYSAERSAASWVEQMRNGTFIAGGVGVRSAIGDTLMGGTTAFAGQRFRCSVGDFHGSAYFADHTYRVDVLDQNGVVFSQNIDPEKLNYFAFDASTESNYYYVEVYDVTTNTLIAIGNPIWNEK